MIPTWRGRGIFFQLMRQELLQGWFRVDESYFPVVLLPPYVALLVLVPQLPLPVVPQVVLMLVPVLVTLVFVGNLCLMGQPSTHTALTHPLIFHGLLPLKYSFVLGIVQALRKLVRGVQLRAVH